MPLRRPAYEEPTIFSREDVLGLLESDPTSQLQTAIVGMALNEPDLEFAYGVIVRAASFMNPYVCGNAVLCLGHLARIHETLPDDRAVELVRAALVDPDDYVRGQAECAAGDLEMFIPALGNGIRGTR